MAKKKEKFQSEIDQPFLHSMEKKSTFLPYRVKKHHSTLEMDTFKVMSLDNKPRTRPGRTL